MPIGKGFSPRLFHSIHLPTMAALVLAIIGGTKSFNPDIDTENTGRMLIKVAVVLFLVVLIVLAMIALVTFSKIGHVVHGERKLVFAAVLSLPFLFVRILYSIIAAFSSPNSKVFSLVSDTKTAVAVQALMAISSHWSAHASHCPEPSATARSGGIPGAVESRPSGVPCRGQPLDDGNEQA